MTFAAVPAGDSPVPYSGRWLDRATDRRTDPVWLAEVRAAPETRVIPIWRDNCIVEGAPARATMVDGRRAQQLLGGREEAVFPRIEPAVIVLVESPTGRCLLARHRNSVLDAFSTLAGFVEIGESLEDAVRREVAEEAGVTVGEVSYLGSQPWPFPAGLMVAFRAKTDTEVTDIDHHELVEARWFTRAELVEQAAAGHLGRVDSIDRVLLRSWLEEPG